MTQTGVDLLRCLHLIGRQRLLKAPAPVSGREKVREEMGANLWRLWVKSQCEWETEGPDKVSNAIYHKAEIMQIWST